MLDEQAAKWVKLVPEVATPESSGGRFLTHESQQ